MRNPNIMSAGEYKSKPGDRLVPLAEFMMEHMLPKVDELNKTPVTLTRAEFTIMVAAITLLLHSNPGAAVVIQEIPEPKKQH